MSTENPDNAPAPAGVPGPHNAGRRSDDFQSALRRGRIAGIAFFAELLILVGVVAALGHRLRFNFLIQAKSPVQVFRVVLFVAAAASVLIARLNNGRMIAEARKASGDPDKLALLSRAALSTMAASLVPAVIGFILFLLAGQVRDFTILAIVSLLLLFFYFPRPAAWEAVLADRRPPCPM